MNSTADNETKFLIHVIGAIIPNTHEKQLQSIVTQTTIPWHERAKQIKTLFMNIQKENPNGVGSYFAEPSDLERWYNHRIEAFKNKFNFK